MCKMCYDNQGYECIVYINNYQGVQWQETCYVNELH